MTSVLILGLALTGFSKSLLKEMKCKSGEAHPNKCSPQELFEFTGDGMIEIVDGVRSYTFIS